MNLASLRPGHQNLLVLLSGALTVFAYAPFNVFVLLPVCWAVLWLLLQEASPRRSLGLGFLWGFGQFWAGGGWLFVALHTFGHMNPLLTILVLSVFFAYLALWGMFASWFFVKLRGTAVLPNALTMAACWSLCEWLRGWIFTGVPWLAVGYTQTPPSPLAGFAPVFGSYGVGFLLILMTALIATACVDKQSRMRAGIAALMIIATGAALRLVDWVHPVGDPIRVALIQPNVPQDLKWDSARLNEWLIRNVELARAHPAQLVAFPETVIPLMESQIPDGYLDALSEKARAMGGDVIAGSFTTDAQGHIFNSALSYGTQPRQVYSKQHLLPFGEYSPPSMHWLLDLVNIPMADQTRGDEEQPPMRIGNQKIAVNICYEDVFGEELIYHLPDATMMLNMSNLAWYGDSHAQPQHLQISQFRAMEMGRPMLRSTNTGMTAIVMPDGSVPHVLKAFTTDAIEADVRGYEGMTPYGRWGNWPVLCAIWISIGFIFWRKKAAPQ